MKFTQKWIKKTFWHAINTFISLKQSKINMDNEMRRMQNTAGFNVLLLTTYIPQNTGHYWRFKNICFMLTEIKILPSTGNKKKKSVYTWWSLYSFCLISPQQLLPVLLLNYREQACLKCHSDLHYIAIHSFNMSGLGCCAPASVCTCVSPFF